MRHLPLILFGYKIKNIKLQQTPLITTKCTLQLLNCEVQMAENVWQAFLSLSEMFMRRDLSAHQEKLACF